MQRKIVREFTLCVLRGARGGPTTLTAAEDAEEAHAMARLAIYWTRYSASPEAKARARMADLAVRSFERSFTDDERNELASLRARYPGPDGRIITALTKFREWQAAQRVNQDPKPG